MKFIFEEFKVEFCQYCQAFATSLADEKESISSFGIFTDQDMSSFVLAYNTQEHIHRKSQAASESISASEAASISFSNKWWIPEWKGDDEKFNPEKQEEFYLKLEKLAGLLPFPLYKDSLFMLYCESLAELRNSGAFLQQTSDFFMLVQESDNFSLSDFDRLKKLLNKEEWEEYLRFNKDFMGLV